MSDEGSILENSLNSLLESEPYTTNSFVHLGEYRDFIPDSERISCSESYSNTRKRSMSDSGLVISPPMHEKVRSQSFRIQSLNVMCRQEATKLSVSLGSINSCRDAIPVKPKNNLSRRKEPVKTILDECKLKHPKEESSPEGVIKDNENKPPLWNPGLAQTGQKLKNLSKKGKINSKNSLPLAKPVHRRGYSVSSEPEIFIVSDKDRGPTEENADELSELSISMYWTENDNQGEPSHYQSPISDDIAYKISKDIYLPENGNTEVFLNGKNRSDSIGSLIQYVDYDFEPIPYPRILSNRTSISCPERLYNENSEMKVNAQESSCRVRKEFLYPEKNQGTQDENCKPILSANILPADLATPTKTPTGALGDATNLI